MKKSVLSIISIAAVCASLMACGGGGGGGGQPSTNPPSSTVTVPSSLSSSSSSLSSAVSSNSSAAVVPLEVKATSYLNKNVNFKFSVHDLFDGWNSVARKSGLIKATESVGHHATAYADFQRNGTYSIIANTSFLGQHDASGNPYHGSIIAVDSSGKNITPLIIEGDTTGCIHPRKALVADFNNDTFPDVFFACHGDDIASTPGEVSRIVLSTSSSKYKVLTVSGTEFGFAHSASAADIDNDGNVDIIIADTKYNENSQSLRILMGMGDGTFVNDTARLDMVKLSKRDAKHANYYSVEIIEIDSVLHILAGGNEVDSDTLVEGDEVHTIMAPVKNGFVDYDNIKLLPVVDNSIPLDFVIDSKQNIFVLRATSDYSGMIIQKVSGAESTVLITHTGPISTKNQSSWIPFFEISNDTLFSVNGDVDEIFKL